MAVKKITKGTTPSNPSTKSPSRSESGASSSGAKADAKETKKVQVTANPRLVQALQNYDEARSQAKSYLVEVATIVQQEKLTKEEVIVSMVEARGIDRKTAGEQYSRIRKLLNDPATLEELRTGIIDLATARERTKSKQKNPSTEKKLANAQKNIVRAITTIINAAKESGTDLMSILSTFKAAAKKAGLK